MRGLPEAMLRRLVEVDRRRQPLPGRGIGRLLIDALRPAAVRAGLTTLVYLVDPTNQPALGLLRSLDVELTFRDGLVQGRQRLPTVQVSGCRGPTQS